MCVYIYIHSVICIVYHVCTDAYFTHSDVELHNVICILYILDIYTSVCIYYILHSVCYIYTTYIIPYTLI